MYNTTTTAPVQVLGAVVAGGGTAGGLAVTGVSTWLLASVGLAVLATGLLLTMLSWRQRIG